MAELTDRLMGMAPPMAEVRPCALENFGPEIQYDHDAATIAMFDMLEEARVSTHVGTTVIRPLMDGARRQVERSRPESMAAPGSCGNKRRAAMLLG